MPSDEPIIRPNYAGTPSVRGTRLSIYNIMDFYLANDPVEWVAAEAFRIPVEDVIAAYAYIKEHEAELMPTYRKFIERNRQGNPPHIEAMLEKSHEKVMRLRTELERQRAEREARDARAAG